MVREKMVIIKSLIKELKSRKIQFNVERLHITSKNLCLNNPLRRFEKAMEIL